ncbi:copper transporter [Thermobifida alba]|uniref:Copper transporter n=1 Tax=Thermobifida alba TaxID=53522 RepID=A0ABY4L0P7_THEAE|nr:copper transporter [Thermobifida alba]UPT21241.1 copper transporter [Thermobifida alba]
MIDFRYHLVSTVAIFLALTVGIVLGTTMLQDPLLHTLKAETAQLREQSERLRTDKDLADQFNAGTAQLITAYETAMLERRLADTRIVVVEPSGVDAAVRDAIMERLRHAGGTVVGRITLTDRYLDPGEADHVDEVADRWSEDLKVPRGTPYERAGAEIAQAVLTADGDESPDGFDPAELLAGYVESGLLAVHGEPASGADAALLLAPAEPFALVADQEGNDTATPPANATVLALARALKRAGAATVLAGAPDADGPTGIIRQARAEKARFTTVDTAGTTAGDIVTVLALALAAEGRDGHYGVGAGVDGFLPAVLPDPRPDPTPTPSTGVSAEDVAADDES